MLVAVQAKNIMTAITASAVGICHLLRLGKRTRRRERKVVSRPNTSIVEKESHSAMHHQPKTRLFDGEHLHLERQAGPFFHNRRTKSGMCSRTERIRKLCPVARLIQR